jgi:hypothetical protein
MRRSSLTLATLGMILLTGFTVTGTGWLSRPPGRHAPCAADPFSTPAAFQYRQSQPHHWHDMMVQR